MGSGCSFGKAPKENVAQLPQPVRSYSPSPQSINCTVDNENTMNSKKKSDEMLTPSNRTQMIEELQDMGIDYWREQIEDWISEFDEKQHDNKNNVINTEEFSDEWMEFEKYIQTVYEKMKEENNYKIDQWDIIEYKLRNERKIYQRKYYLHQQYALQLDEHAKQNSTDNRKKQLGNADNQNKSETPNARTSNVSFNQRKSLIEKRFNYSKTVTFYNPELKEDTISKWKIIEIGKGRFQQNQNDGAKKDTDREEHKQQDQNDADEQKQSDHDDNKTECKVEMMDIDPYGIRNKMETMLNKKVEEFGDEWMKQMQIERANENCCSEIKDHKQLINNCPCIQRIDLVLSAYHCLMNTEEKISIEDIIQIQDKYEYQQLFEDFSHVKFVHIDTDNRNDNPNIEHEYYHFGVNICKNFELKYKCENNKKCKNTARFCQAEIIINNSDDIFISDKNTEINDKTDAKNDEIETPKIKLENQTSKSSADIYSCAPISQDRGNLFSLECTKIHGYFLHSTVKFGTQFEQEAKIEDKCIARYFRHSYYEDAEKMDEKIVEKESDGVSKKSYVGKKEDEQWWENVTPNSSQRSIYGSLIENMDVFRWQNPHGFFAGTNQEISHYKPRFPNLKEEVLHNEFVALSADSWNQTLRKSTVCFNSWVAKRIKIKHKGYFDDRVTEQKAEWDPNDEKNSIQIFEIVPLKLYTDFDKLQFALKKCFRYDTLRDILPITDVKSDVIDFRRQQSRNNRDDLKNRLESFYHWRGNLLIVLNKFGTKLTGNNNMVIYHGVNKKMLVKPSQTFAFNGPLSTSASYHVARTFATAKGMVLKITSHFPRLNYCNAFDASLLSDYPEEQEWLIGFMYVRVLEVRTRRLIGNNASWKVILKKVPLASWMRQAFFAMHLFKEGIFSMSEHLERILAQCLKVNRYECCEQTVIEKYKDQHNYFKDWGMNVMIDKICAVSHKNRPQAMTTTKSEITTVSSPTSRQNTQQDLEKKDLIVSLLWKQFNDFRLQPNFKQRIKFDTISENLKRFFMEQTEEFSIKTKQKLWRISWDEITMVFPNVEEIHFINQYRLSDIVFANLLEHIKSKQNKIEKVVFLYYDYKSKDDTNKPMDGATFQDPDTLRDVYKRKLEKLGWIMKYGNNGRTGYKIRLCAKSNSL